MIPLTKVRRSLREVTRQAAGVNARLHEHWGSPLGEGRAVMQLETIEDDLRALATAVSAALLAIRTVVVLAEAEDGVVWDERMEHDRLAEERELV